MAFHVKYDDITSCWLQACGKLGSWNDQLQGVSGSFTEFLKLESFQGQTADAVKSYISDVHFSILVCFGEILNEYQSRFLLYRDGYYQEVDTDLHAEICEETLAELIKFFPQSQQGFATQHEAITGTCNTVFDLVDLGAPSDFDIQDSYSTVLRRMQELEENTRGYEAVQHGSALNNFRQMLVALKSFIGVYLNQPDSGLMNYQPGAACAQKSFAELQMAIANAYQVRTELGEELAAASEYEAARMQLLEEEWAKQREEEGMWQWIAGAGAVVVGTICIVATAGAATPLVVAGFAVGMSAVAYGAAEMYEGSQEMHYGNIGDPYTLSHNPIRDTIFGGNQNAYDIWGTASTTVAGMLIPVGQGYTAATSAFGNVTKQTIARSIAYEVCKDGISGAVGMGAGYLGTEWGSQAFGADAGRWIGLASGLFAGMGTAGGIDALNQSHNWSGLARGLQGGPAPGTSNKPLQNLDEGMGRAVEHGSPLDIDASKIDYSKSAVHSDRPYQQSSQTIQEIVNSGTPITDPRGSNGFWWDVDGSFNGISGHYELLISPDKTTIWHYLFKSY